MSMTDWLHFKVGYKNALSNQSSFGTHSNPCNFSISDHLGKKTSIYTILLWNFENGYVNPKVIYVIRFWFFFQPPHPDLQHGAITSYSVGYRLANSSEPYRYATVDARDPHVKKAYFSSSKNLVGLCLHVCSHGSTPNSIYFLFFPL